MLQHLNKFALLNDANVVKALKCSTTTLTKNVEVTKSLKSKTLRKSILFV